VIMARIDRLDDASKRLLQFASVIGRKFTRRLLDRIADAPSEIGVSLDALKAGELIYETRAFPEPGYLFKHGLTQEVAYNSLPVQRRQELHRRIGEAIEEVYADRLPEHYEVLAHHFSRGLNRAKSLEYLMKAGAKAVRAHANREALALYEQALAVVGPDEAARADVLKNLAIVTQYLGDADTSLRHAEGAVELYEKLGDKPNAVSVHLHIQMLYTWQWDGAREDMGLKHLEAAAALV